MRLLMRTLAVAFGIACLSSQVLAQEACPERTRFWEEQCEQGRKSIVCLEGMHNLFRCVITETDVVQWQKNDGSFETTASLQALSNANLFAALCSQLSGPFHKTARDAAEAEYLALLLNICSGALPLGTPVPGGGNVGGLIDSFENAINTGVAIEEIQKLVERVNKGLVDATRCADPTSLFRGIPPC